MPWPWRSAACWYLSPDVLSAQKNFKETARAQRWYCVGASAICVSEARGSRGQEARAQTYKHTREAVSRAVGIVYGYHLPLRALQNAFKAQSYPQTQAQQETSFSQDAFGEMQVPFFSNPGNCRHEPEPRFRVRSMRRHYP